MCGAVFKTKTCECEGARPPSSDEHGLTNLGECLRLQAREISRPIERRAPRIVQESVRSRGREKTKALLFQKGPWICMGAALNCWHVFEVSISSLQMLIKNSHSWGGSEIDLLSEKHHRRIHEQFSSELLVKQQVSKKNTYLPRHFVTRQLRTRRAEVSIENLSHHHATNSEEKLVQAGQRHRHAEPNTAFCKRQLKEADVSGGSL